MGLGAAIITALFWSFLAILLKVALKYSDSASIVFYRMIVALVLVFIYQSVTDFKKIKALKNIPFILIIASFCLGINYFGYMKGVELTAPANAQIFIQLAPLMLAIFGIFYFKESISKAQIIGFFLALVGYSFFYYDRVDNFIRFNDGYYEGQAWILLGAVTWAAFAILQKIILKNWSSHQINIIVYSICALMTLPFVNWHSLYSLTLAQHLLFISLGINTLISYGCLSIALKNLPASLVSPILIANPILTLVLLYIMESLQINWFTPDGVKMWGYIGSFFVVLGVGLVVTFKKK